jgi:ActR/RegA family two-component response regulator
MSAVLLCDDLLFASRITGTAKALGLELKCARSIPELTTLLITQSPTCVLVDLHHAGLSVADFVKNLPDPRPLVVGYGSHVDAPTLKAARAAGCDLVLPRSKFVEDLPTALPNWLQGSLVQIQ